MWWILWSCIWTTFYNKCSQRYSPTSMPTWSPGTLDRHRLHPRCKRTCRFLFSYLWEVVELLLPVPLADKPTCRISCMLYLHWPVGPKGSPNFAGRSPCSLRHTGDMQIWPGIDTPSAVSSSSKLGWVSSWIWSDPLPISLRYPSSLFWF